jgi:hypothetical protein
MRVEFAFCLEVCFHSKLSLEDFLTKILFICVLEGWSDEGDAVAVIRFEISVFSIYRVFCFV